MDLSTLCKQYDSSGVTLEDFDSETSVADLVDLGWRKMHAKMAVRLWNESNSAVTQPSPSPTPSPTPTPVSVSSDTEQPSVKQQKAPASSGSSLGSSQVKKSKRLTPEQLPAEKAFMDWLQTQPNQRVLGIKMGMFYNRFPQFGGALPKLMELALHPKLTFVRGESPGDHYIQFVGGGGSGASPKEEPSPADVDGGGSGASPKEEPSCVGRYVQGKNGNSWGYVTGQRDGRYILSTGSYALESTYGEKWGWADQPRNVEKTVQVACAQPKPEEWKTVPPQNEMVYKLSFLITHDDTEARDACLPSIKKFIGGISQTKKFGKKSCLIGGHQSPQVLAVVFQKAESEPPSFWIDKMHKRLLKEGGDPGLVVTFITNEEAHEIDKKQFTYAKQPQCRYGKKCRMKSTCNFAHPKQQCRYGESCTKKSTCTFAHPGDTPTSSSQLSPPVSSATPSSPQATEGSPYPGGSSFAIDGSWADYESDEYDVQSGETDSW